MERQTSETAKITQFDPKRPRGLNRPRRVFIGPQIRSLPSYQAQRIVAGIDRMIRSRGNPSPDDDPTPTPPAA